MLPKLGNVWPNCKIQIIDEKTDKWKTICEVLDTPKDINAAKEKHSKYKHLWVKHCYGREPLF